MGDDYGRQRTFRSRSRSRVAKNLGVISLDVNKKVNIVRSKKLDFLDSYYEKTQYDHLPKWDQDEDAWGQHIAVRKRAPRLNYPFAKTLSQRVAAKLFGLSTFPSLIVEDSPLDQEFFKAIVRESKLKALILEPTRRMLNSGTVLIRYYIIAGKIKIEWFAAKYCYPIFQPSGDLASVTVKYVYDDLDDLNDDGSPKKKWYRLDLTMTSEILYDNPEYRENEEPEFQVVEQVDHNLGFVQAGWWKTCDVSGSEDGYGFTEDITDFIDEINYSLSQSSQAVGYNQDPQLVFTKMTEEEQEDFIRSASKSWHLGRDGDAKFLESDLSGVQTAMELRDKVRTNIGDISRIVMHDPDKIVGNAQSAKAMEVLHGPLKDLIDELRLPAEDNLRNFILKMAMSVLMAHRQGIAVPIDIPAGYNPESINLTFDWPPIFQQTIEDLQKKVGVGSAAATANLISRKSITRWLAKDFNIEDVEAEIAEIEKQPILNPFGGF